MPWLSNKSTDSPKKKFKSNFLIKHKRLFISLQVLVFVALLGIGISVTASFSLSDGQVVVRPDDQSTFEILEATTSASPFPSQESTPIDSPDVSPDGVVRDSKVQKIFDDMAACMAVLNARNETLRGYAMQSNAINDQLNNLPPINFDANLTPEQSQVLIDERNALQESLRAQIAEINSQEFAYEQTLSGGSCFQGSGPFPQ